MSDNFFGPSRLALKAKLSRRTFLGASAAASLVAGCSKEKNPGPNILLILMDDVGRDAIEAYGGKWHTPNISSLAETGLKFTQGYSTALCGTSRAQLMTGLYPFRTGWTKNLWELPKDKRRLDPSIRTFSQTLRKAGYATAVAGKWQLARLDDRPGHPHDAGFDEYCLYDPSIRPASPYWSPTLRINEAYDPSYTEPDTYGPDVTTDFLIDFMSRRSEPFLAYYPLFLCHGPFTSTPANRVRQDWRKHDPRWYGDMVRYMDGLVGGLIGALDGLGLRDRTLVLLTSDNGTDNRIATTLGDKVIKPTKKSKRKRSLSKRKRSYTDLGIRQPMIANWPGTVAPGTFDRLVDLSDFHVTLAEVGNAAAPKTDGISFAPALFGGAAEPRPWILVQYEDNKKSGHSWNLVRDQEWKLISDGQLFDMKNDPWEETAIFPENDTPESTAARRKLSAVMAGLH